MIHAFGPRPKKLPSGRRRVAAALGAALMPALAWGLAGGNAFAASTTIAVDPPGPIPDLVWSAKEPTVRALKGSDGKTAVFAIVDGTYPKADWTLLFRTQKINRNAAGRFRLTLPITGPETTYQFTAVSPLGKTQRETIRVLTPEYERIRKEAANRKRSALSVSLGLTAYSYNQVDVAKLAETALTLKVAYLYTLSARWDVAASLYTTALPLTSSNADSARFLGLSARAGYVFFQDHLWKWSLLGGLNYTSMFVGDDMYGFRNLFGPQLFPTLTRNLDDGDQISAYLKYSPITDGASVLRLSNREIALGALWRHRLKSGHTLAYSLDYSNLAVQFADQEVTLNSLSLSVGLSW